MATQATRFDVRPARAWRALVLLALALATAVTLLWAATVFERGEFALAWLTVPSLLVVTWAAGVGRAHTGTLRDEGGQWWFEPAVGTASAEAEPGSLQVTVDFGSWMLLGFRGEQTHRFRWLAPSSRDMSLDWPAFRRAVYSPRLTPAGRSAQAPADPPA